MRKTTVACVAYVTSRHHFTHRCLVTPFPATRMDKTEALHMPRLCLSMFLSWPWLIVVYPLSMLLSWPWKKAVKWSGEISAGDDVFHLRREQRRAVVHKTDSHKT